MKDYQVLISGVLIAVAIYLGLTYQEPDPYAGAFKVPEPVVGLRSYSGGVAHVFYE